jgi:hypothetical protein
VIEGNLYYGLCSGLVTELLVYIHTIILMCYNSKCSEKGALSVHVIQLSIKTLTSKFGIGMDPLIERSLIMIKRLNILRKQLYDFNHQDIKLRWEMFHNRVDEISIIEYAIADRSNKLPLQLKIWDSHDLSSGSPGRIVKVPYALCTLISLTNHFAASVVLPSHHSCSLHKRMSYFYEHFTIVHIYKSYPSYYHIKIVHYPCYHE